jgi:hypothetical protein
VQETEAGPMPTSLSWGLPTACQVVSDMVIQMKNFKKTKKKLVQSSHDETMKMVCK